MAPLELVGWFATLMSVPSLLPQLWRSWRRRSAEDISFGWLGMAIAATSAWLVYGLMLPSTQVAVTNALVDACLLALAAMKIAFKPRPAPVPAPVAASPAEPAVTQVPG